MGQLFNETGKQISEQKEITGVSTMKFKDATWMSTSLLCEKAYQITNAKAYVFSDSVLWVGKMGEDPIATWKIKIKWHPETSLQGYESNRWYADGVPVEKIPRNHNVGPPREDSKSNGETYSVNLSTSKTGSSSCQCTTTLHGEKKEVQKDLNTIHTIRRGSNGRRNDVELLRFRSPNNRAK